MHEVYINGKKYVETIEVRSPKLMDKVLSTPIHYELGHGTIRDYLRNLLLRLWDEDEGFSGKRPFGNSGWYLDLVYALAKNELLTGLEIDEDGFVEFLPEDQQKIGYGLITDAINHIFKEA
jgi:hypothetical protein